jgi:hypothetical protein
MRHTALDTGLRYHFALCLLHTRTRDVSLTDCRHAPGCCAYTAVTRISRAVPTHPTIEKTMRPRHDVRHRVSQSQDSLQCTLKAWLVQSELHSSAHTHRIQAEWESVGTRGNACYSVHSAQPLRTTQPAHRIARNWKHVQQSHSKVTEADHGLPVPNSAVTHELPAWHDMHDHLASILRRSEL